MAVVVTAAREVGIDSRISLVGEVGVVRAGVGGV